MVGYIAAYTKIAFLWHNLIGAVVVFGVGMLVSELTGPTTRPKDSVGPKDSVATSL